MHAAQRSAVVGAATTLLAVVLAGAYALGTHGRTDELPALAIWSSPLGALVATVTRRPRFTRLPASLRAAALAVGGLVAGGALAALGWVLLGGWMLAWDFPVLYCWMLAGAVGALAGALWNGSLLLQHTAVGLVTALLPLMALGWVGSRPTPGVVIVYRDSPGRDAAQDVLDSVLTRPHPRQGRDLRWGSTGYSRTLTPDGRTAAVISLRRAADRDSLRAALAGHPLVASVTDTLLPR